MSFSNFFHGLFYKIYFKTSNNEQKRYKNEVYI